MIPIRGRKRVLDIKYILLETKVRVKLNAPLMGTET